MEIERINENTVKFYISYVDIEERGFNREEIWYDRERSEELFWEMMDEIHHEEEFVPEGPLWIQVQALDKGLEVLVTKAQLSNDGQRFELPISEEKLKDLPINDRIEEFLDEHFQSKQFLDDNDTLEFMLGFKEFEDVISLSKRTELDELQTKLFSFKNKYYLYVEFPDDLFEEEDIDNLLSILLEYGDESSLTVHRLQEYGNLIIDENVFATINKYFH
ncbi:MULTISPECIES: adaptor protein MecA [Heyndrickxia]|jgi:adapter protein MecA 1/2|uniref:Adapter protein MecA n=1 Tax=Heyndrickxia oleronia TaxID=38875 RepID=A0AAW6SZ95_9BACI|nr:adaptor protein MecA [Heyndrickxia oleronia]NYV67766.1 adaptor protein MecA [Bacillus sp. Gen3]OJH17654.1 adaptor protein MecA [Bacillus obstructivus]MBU5211762.1 adaptor protein MecA [Heyndrickxia oleronia]MCI1590453.1 adaptor protein MecA [Heyndrickxia oleronia]MCI1611286.1 adaptor protein MecA [Heyndrickxia oleronia]